MKTKIMATLALVTALALTGCGPEQGTVLDKNHTEEYYTYNQTCTGYNQNGTCRSYMPTQQYHPDSYSLLLENGEDKGWRSVTEGTYNEYEIGEFYSAK